MDYKDRMIELITKIDDEELIAYLYYLLKAYLE